MPSCDHNDERSVRIQKLHALRALGINPYPDKFDKKQDISHISEQGAGVFRTIEEIIL